MNIFLQNFANNADAGCAGGPPHAAQKSKSKILKLGK